ncbi:MAG: adenylate kinase [Oscillospiraceae bacterium]
MKLMFLGAPGAGKGTQAELVAKALGIPTISTGNILRTAIKNGTAVGLKAKAFIEKGILVPDDVIIGIVRERLAESDCVKGFILDGMPRTIAQAEALETSGVEFDAVISIEVSDEVIEKRMTGRRTCSACGATFHTEANPPEKEGICDNCGGELSIRKDDMPETVKNRLKIYHVETEPLLGFYKERGKLRTVASQEKVSDTTKLIFDALGMTE